MTYVPNLRNLVKSSPELTEPEVSEIKGRLPPWLKGNYIRNGPGKWDLSPEFHLNHVFDGMFLLVIISLTVNSSTGDSCTLQIVAGQSTSI